MKNDAKSLSLEEKAALGGFTVEYLIKNLSDGQFRYWLSHKGEYKENLSKAFSITDEYAGPRREWEQFYRDEYKWSVVFDSVIIPKKPKNGLWRAIFMPKGLIADKIYDMWPFGKWRVVNDLDKAFPIHRRTSKESYAIWVIDSDEPDEEFRGKSTKGADPDMIIGMTLPERMIFEHKYFSETGEHLDVKGGTLCSGSRDADGYVPYVYWNPYYEKVDVGWYDVGYSAPNYGLRRAVS